MMNNNEITTQPALLLRDAYIKAIGMSALNRNVMVVANGHVIFTALHDVDVSLRFSIEQWNQIVEFVDNQLLDGSERACQDEDWVDWSHVSSRCNYVAADESGVVWEYRNEPSIKEELCVWWPKNDVAHQKILLKYPKHINWRESLRKRPG